MRRFDTERTAGFTLVEILVVLAIMGAVTGAAVLALGAADRTATAESEANRLANQLTLAADEVLVTSRPLQLVWDEDGYSFFASGAEAWEPYAGGSLAGRHELLGGAKLAGAPSPLLIIDGGTGPAARFTVAGSRRWTIDFDGLSAAVSS